MNTTLYLHTQTLDGNLTLGHLHEVMQIGNTPAWDWISVEPRPYIPMRNGKPHIGRLPELAPLMSRLPDGYDDLPLLTATLYAENQWLHLHDCHVMSKLPARRILWSLTELSEPTEVLHDVMCQRQQVLTWQDRARFGIDENFNLPEKFTVDRYYHYGRPMAWRIVTNLKERAS